MVGSKHACNSRPVSHGYVLPLWWGVTRTQAERMLTYWATIHLQEKRLKQTHTVVGQIALQRPETQMPTQAALHYTKSQMCHHNSKDIQSFTSSTEQRYCTKSFVVSHIAQTH